jgi:hypothetical protein
MIQKIKCFFGFHDLVDHDSISVGNPGHWRPLRYCRHCRRGGDAL